MNFSKIKENNGLSSSIDKLYAGFDYVNPLVKMLICYKYKKQQSLKWALGYLLHLVIKDIAHDIDYIIPVPVHKKRRKERGYDHILLLLDYYIITDATNIIRKDIVVKTSYHQPQMGLTEVERNQNLHGTFKITQNVANKNILVVDDVYTTGATLDEVSRILKDAGAKNVYACVLLRKEPYVNE
ncbi:MAG: ComF family protein [Neisseriaceae bacterium]